MKKTCSKCEVEKEIGSFSVVKRKPDGTPLYFNSWCNACRTKDNRKRSGAEEKPKPAVEDDRKECLECHLIKPLDDFSPAVRGRCGRAAYCKTCRNPKYRNADKSREATASYRSRHRERWRAMHRIHQFKRRYRIAVTSDGSVTDEFLKTIYEKEICFWCDEFVPEEERTLEHIKELIDGGTHTVDNITMACFKCNSSRKNRNGKAVR